MKEENNKINIKKYGIMLVFKATRCDLKISKRKEIRLKEINKEIIKLKEEQDNLFIKEGK